MIGGCVTVRLLQIHADPPRPMGTKQATAPSTFRKLSPSVSNRQPGQLRHSGLDSGLDMAASRIALGCGGTARDAMRRFSNRLSNLQRRADCTLWSQPLLRHAAGLSSAHAPRSHARPAFHGRIRSVARHFALENKGNTRRHHHSPGFCCHRWHEVCLSVSGEKFLVPQEAASVGFGAAEVHETRSSKADL
jgi:hypothetical protein